MSESRARPRVLVISKNVPWPPNSGEKMRTSGLVQALAGSADVRVLAFCDEHDDASANPSANVSVRAVPRRRAGSARLLANALRFQSITTGKWWDPRLDTAIEDELGAGYDAVVVCHVQLAHYLRRRLRRDYVSVLDMHNVESSLTRRLAERSGPLRRSIMRAEAAALRRHERRETRRFDAVTTVSDVDRRQLVELTGRSDVLVVPNAVDSPETPLAMPADPVVCFVALMSWAPNADAAVWFTNSVWPRIVESVPTARLMLVGRDPSPEVRRLAADTVTVTGTVPDVRPWYAKSRIAIAPLRAGGGSRLKIMEALSYGRPVVATSVGAEGLTDLLGRGVDVSDDPLEMAGRIVTLLVDDDRWEKTSRAGADAVREDHSWDAACSGLVERLRLGTT